MVAFIDLAALPGVLLAQEAGPGPGVPAVPSGDPAVRLGSADLAMPLVEPGCGRTRMPRGGGSDGGSGASSAAGGRAGGSALADGQRDSLRARARQQEPSAALVRQSGVVVGR
jgi:hypothetical protein